MSILNGKIENIVYYNEENFYSILRCRDSKESFTVVGNIPTPARGREYDFNGDWVTHPKYGKQFKLSSYKEVMPTSEKGIEEYLSCGLIKGVGPTTAKRIVATFGTDTLNVIEENPERLLDVKGIGKKSLEKIIFGWSESKEIRKIMEFLQRHGAPISLAAKIYKQYGTDSIDVITDNPYLLTEDVLGIGFKTADAIALEMGFEMNNPYRLKAGIIAYLKRISVEGHCYEDGKTLTSICSMGLNVSYEDLYENLKNMIIHKDGVICEDGAVYLKSSYYAEYGVAKKLYEINQFACSTALADIDYLEESFGIEYDEIQIDAIKNSLKNKVAIITGGPGTGKTTIIKAIVKSFDDYNKKVVLASPTGRAANRMAEVVGMEAKTIHRLLEYSPQGSFLRNEDNPIEGDVLVLDECSMIDINLMYNLLKAVPESMNIIMVGDVDQLPSVGPGNVLSDIINSECFYVARLEKVFRQAEESDIVVNAHRINRGERLKLRDRDVQFVETKNIRQAILDIVAKENPADVQVLSPVKKTDFGTIELNNALQNLLNKSETVLERKYVQFRIGDRVMQIKNNYDKEVFNGSLGVISGYNKEDKILTVDFDGNYVTYDSTDMDEIMLAYAITVHKSQGSEFPVVIIPLSMEHLRMLQRNLIYTAFTRPSEKLYLVGSREALNYAIDNDVSTQRKTRLIPKIQKWNKM